MASNNLLHLIHAPLDVDYVQHFQGLAALNLEIKRLGPSAERMLRKAILEMDVGNFEAGVKAAEHARELSPSTTEIHYQYGLANVLLACAKADAIPSGPGQQIPARTGVKALLEEAVEAFEEVVNLNDCDDEARRGLRALKTLLADGADERSIVKALKSL